MSNADQASQLRQGQAVVNQMQLIMRERRSSIVTSLATALNAEVQTI